MTVDCRGAQFFRRGEQSLYDYFFRASLSISIKALRSLQIVRMNFNKQMSTSSKTLRISQRDAEKLRDAQQLQRDAERLRNQSLGELLTSGRALEHLCESERHAQRLSNPRNPLNGPSLWK